MNNTKPLIWFREAQRSALVTAIMQHVAEYGEEPTDYDFDQFGLDNDRQERTIKVYDLLNNGGCYFFECSSHNPEFDPLTPDNFYDTLYAEADFCAYQCLYIVEDEDTGHQSLKYYRFTNGGLSFDEDQSEPDHGYVRNLPLIDLDHIIAAIVRIEENIAHRYNTNI